MNIDDMPAGREMDAIIAEKVMGAKIQWIDLSPPFGRGRNLFYGEGEPNENQPIERYSTEISAAWGIVEKMREHNSFGPRSFWLWSSLGSLVTWHADFYDEPTQGSEANTAPLAICRAALKVAEEK